MLSEDCEDGPGRREWAFERRRVEIVDGARASNSAVAVVTPAVRTPAARTPTTARAPVKAPQPPQPECSVCLPMSSLRSPCLRFLAAERALKALFHRRCWGEPADRLRQLPWLRRYHSLLRAEAAGWGATVVDPADAAGLPSDGVVTEGDQRTLRLRAEKLMRRAWATYWAAHRMRDARAITRLADGWADMLGQLEDCKLEMQTQSDAGPQRHPEPEAGRGAVANSRPILRVKRKLSDCE